MVYFCSGMELEVISVVLHGKVNDVLICRDRLSAAGTLYTLLAIHDRACAKTVLGVMENGARNGETPYLFRFSQNEELLFAFPYREERSFADFARGQLVHPGTAEEIGINMVMECMSSTLPWPLLNLVLEQGCIHITKENNIYFSTALDLAELREDTGERVCVSGCARILMELLDCPLAGKKRKRRKRPKSLELIWKKTEKNAYTGFHELYHDIKLTAQPAKKKKLRQRIKGVWLRNKDRLFRLLLVVSVLLVLIALIVLVSQLIFGEIPMLRLFQNNFDVIGTENLHQGGRL